MFLFPTWKGNFPEINLTNRGSNDDPFLSKQQRATCITSWSSLLINFKCFAVLSFSIFLLLKRVDSQNQFTSTHWYWPLTNDEIWSFILLPTCCTLIWTEIVFIELCDSFRFSAKEKMRKRKSFFLGISRVFVDFGVTLVELHHGRTVQQTDKFQVWTSARVSWRDESWAITSLGRRVHSKTKKASRWTYPTLQWNQYSEKRSGRVTLEVNINIDTASFRVLNIYSVPLVHWRI